jgi:hypothetical protein
VGLRRREIERGGRTPVRPLRGGVLRCGFLRSDDAILRPCRSGRPGRCVGTAAPAATGTRLAAPRAFVAIDRHPKRKEITCWP